MKETPMAVTAAIEHQVKDYDAWREAYDAFADVQKANGVTSESVHRSKDDGNDLLVIHRFANVEDADAFFALPVLREKMQQGGVEGEPRIEIYQDA